MEDFDVDEIIPKGYTTYEEYLNDLNEFLYKYQIIFTNNIYNEKKELIKINRAVNSLINKDYEMYPKEFLNYFNSIKEYMKYHIEDSKVIYEFLMDLSTMNYYHLQEKMKKK